jgi:hypothetical protein
MQTPSHFLMTAALGKGLRLERATTRAFVAGSVAPDVPLYLLSFGGWLYYHVGLGWPAGRVASEMYGQLFFRDPLWIALHNLLHSPALLGVSIAGLWLARGRVPSWPLPFLLGCLLHSGVDIVTHHDDGPLVLFPLNWTLRLSSPVSYWDARYHGRPFGLLELLFDAGLLVYLFGPRLTKSLGARASEPAT